MAKTAAILRIDEEIRKRFPTVRGNVGVLACRTIANTNPEQWSQHAYQNATDYYGPHEDLERLYLWLVSQRGTLPIATVCYNHKGGCTTSHTGHLHVDGPHMTGTPACAGGSPSPPAPTRSSTTVTAGPSGLLDGLFDGPTGTPFGGEATGQIVGAIASPITSTVDFLSLLTETETWIRVLMFTGGTALILMGLSALLGSQVVDVAGILPGPAGKVAKAGANIGGK